MNVVYKCRYSCMLTHNVDSMCARQSLNSIIRRMKFTYLYICLCMEMIHHAHAKILQSMAVVFFTTTNTVLTCNYIAMNQIIIILYALLYGYGLAM